MVMMSACLVGKNVRYDGKSSTDERAIKISEEEEVILICPEVEGGLPIPRTPCEIVGGDGADVLCGRACVKNKLGGDNTRQFIAGAEKILEFAKKYKPDKIYLKAKSPSCGCGSIYDGSFSGKLKNGNGITAQLLMDNGFKVISL